MSRKELVLCVGMHRSGTCLAASMLESLGVCLPGELIAADASNQSGYFENRIIVDSQEKLLQDLGYWWPTGAPVMVPASMITKVYCANDWLTNHLDELLDGGHAQIAIKTRTSLLIPAWRKAASRLGLSLRAVICVRDPRDVCLSLVCRDGPSVGMTWSRSQRLWMVHYKYLLRELGDIPAFVVSYENWLDSHTAKVQLSSLARFVGQSCTSAQQDAALDRICPDFNHGGVEQVSDVHRSLRSVHAKLLKPASSTAELAQHIWRCAAFLEANRVLQALRERFHVFFLYLPYCRRLLGPALDPATISDQLGSDSLQFGVVFVTNLIYVLTL